MMTNQFIEKEIVIEGETKILELLTFLLRLQVKRSILLFYSFQVLDQSIEMQTDLRASFK